MSKEVVVNMTREAQEQLHKAECFKPYELGDTCVYECEPYVVVTSATDISCRMLAEFIGSGTDANRHEFLQHFTKMSVVNMLIARQHRISEVSKKSISKPKVTSAVGHSSWT